MQAKHGKEVSGHHMASQELNKTLWEAADRLRAQMDAAEYKHLVLGLIFLKCFSDSFEERRRLVAELLWRTAPCQPTRAAKARSARR